VFLNGIGTNLVSLVIGFVGVIAAPGTDDAVQTLAGRQPRRRLHVAQQGLRDTTREPWSTSNSERRKG
jgi:hypothetical protein